MYADYNKNIEPEDFFDKSKVDVKHKDIELSELVIRDNDVIEDYEFNFE